MPINIEEIKAGWIATVKLTGPHKMRKTGNPLADRVTRDHVLKVNLAGPKSYARSLAKEGETPAGEAPWFEWVKDGVVRSRKTGELYIAGLPSKAKRVLRYYVDGRPATESELQQIKDFTPSTGELKFITFKIEDVSNVEEPNVEEVTEELVTA